MPRAKNENKGLHHPQKTPTQKTRGGGGVNSKKGGGKTKRIQGLVEQESSRRSGLLGGKGGTFVGVGRWFTTNKKEREKANDVARS